MFANPGYWADVNDPNIVSEPNDPNAVWVDGDYHLKSQAGRYDPNSQSWPCTESGTGWVIDDVTSPCIIVRREISEQLVCDLDTLLGVVTDAEVDIKDRSIAVYGLNDQENVLQEVIHQIKEHNRER